MTYNEKLRKLGQALISVADDMDRGELVPGKGTAFGPFGEPNCTFGQALYRAGFRPRGAHGQNPAAMMAFVGTEVPYQYLRLAGEVGEMNDLGAYAKAASLARALGTTILDGLPRLPEERTDVPRLPEERTDWTSLVRSLTALVPTTKVPA